MRVLATCSGCGQKFAVKEALTKRRISVEDCNVGVSEVTLSEYLMLTVLTCPHCGREMTVQVDDCITEKLLTLQINLNSRIGKTKYYAGEPTQKQLDRQRYTSQRLIHERERLSRLFDGMSYQFDESMKKLEFCEPTTEIVGDTEASE